MQVRKQQLELDMEQQTGSKLEKEYVKAVYCHPAYLTSTQSTSWEMLGWKKHKLKSRLPGEISITSDMQMTHPYGRKWEELKSLLKVKVESEKVGLKLNIQKTKIMASSPITSWQIDGERVETVATVADFIFLGSKIIMDGDCSHEVKRHWSLKESFDQPRQHMKKQKHYFANKCLSSQSYGFSSSHVWMWDLDYKESWALKNRRFWTVVLEKTLKSPLDSKEIQPVNPKEKSVLSIHWKDWCWSWNSNTLATWCKELTHLKRRWCWEILKAGREGDNRRWDGWMASRLYGHEFE